MTKEDAAALAQWTKGHNLDMVFANVGKKATTEVWAEDGERAGAIVPVFADRA